MVRKISSILLATFLLISIFLSSSVSSCFADTNPQNINVGLYFNNGSNKSAISQLNVDTPKGLQIGTYKNNDFTVLYSHASSSCLNIRKAVSPSSTGQPNTSVVVSNFSEDILTFDTVNTSLVVRSCGQYNERILRINEDNDKKYRGELKIRRFSSSDMTVVNTVNIEDYLKGVVPSEIYPSAPPEALKAQAVACRNYALNSIGTFKSLGFDVCTTQASQCYKGASKEHINTNKAVDETSDKRLIFGDKLAQVFYFATSGGKTEDVSNVWGSYYPYLKSVEDSYESDNVPNHIWEITLTPHEVKKIAANSGYESIGDIVDIKITKTAESGRALELIIFGTNGSKTFTKCNCRSALGLKSQWFTITKEVNTTGEIYRISGKGYGHAIGMCQHGAIGMAKAGFNYIEILTHYFPGTSVK